MGDLRNSQKSAKLQKRGTALSLALGVVGLGLFSFSGCIHRVIPTKKVFRDFDPLLDLAPTEIRFHFQEDSIEVRFGNGGKCTFNREAQPTCLGLNSEWKIEDVKFDTQTAGSPFFRFRLDFQTLQGDLTLPVRIEIRGKNLPLSKLDEGFNGLRISRRSESAGTFFSALTQDLRETDRIGVSTVQYEVFLDQNSAPQKNLGGFQAFATLLKKDSETAISTTTRYDFSISNQNSEHPTLFIEKKKSLNAIESVLDQTRIEGSWDPRAGNTAENCFYPEPRSELSAICF